MMMIKTTVIMMWCRTFLVVLSERNYVQRTIKFYELSYHDSVSFCLVKQCCLRINPVYTQSVLYIPGVLLLHIAHVTNFKFYCCCFILMFRAGQIIKLDVQFQMLLFFVECFLSLDKYKLTLMSLCRYFVSLLLSCLRKTLFCTLPQRRINYFTACPM